MYNYHCLNPISKNGLMLFGDTYRQSEKLEEADCILVRSHDMHSMELPENIIAVARAGAGVNNIPLDSYAKSGVFVFNTPGANANSVKEMVFAAMYLSARDILGGNAWCNDNASLEDISKQAEKAKKMFAGGELAGKKLGVIGLGAIGVRVANEATHMDMEVYGYDPYISVSAAWALSRRVKHIDKLDELLKDCDYISIHVPLTPSTKGMIDKKCISRIKKGAVLLNFARDELVDEVAVVKAVKEGKIRKYFSDFPNPTTAGVENIVLTPHIGASTAEAEENCAIMAVKELKDFMENGNVKNSVNLPNLDMGPLDAPMRVCIVHKNLRGFIAKFTRILDEANVNVSDMANKSRGEYAYSMMDLDSIPNENCLNHIASLEESIRVRVIK